MASAHDLLEAERKAAENELILTATATLTAAQIHDYKIIAGTHASVAIALTLPAAASHMAGLQRIIVDGGAAAVTVVVAAGYGGAGSGSDTATLAQGEAVVVVCDGSYWYVVHNEPTG
jgi:hypothetical protein